jgi:dethiobiotin synthetase
MKPLFVTGIGTGVGKTIVAAILVEKLKADYWKPVQSGDLNDSDTLKVRSLVSNSISKFHPEAYRLTQPFSPHKSAELDNIRIDLNQISLPKTSNQLLIEGAGGLMVPLNENKLIIDLIEKLEVEVILVVRNYLGSINHTLLSVSELNRRNIPIKALVFNGTSDNYSESFIINYTKVETVIRVPDLKSLDQINILRQSEGLQISV